MDALISDYLVPLMDSRAWARVVILGGIALGLWLGLGRTPLDRRQQTVTWLAVMLPLLAWYLVIWQFARSGGFQARPVDGSTPLLPMAISCPR